MFRQKISRTYAIIAGVFTGGIILTLVSPNFMDALRVAVDGIRFN